jgi:hypothetical protein
LEGNGKGEATQDEASQGDASQRGAKKTLSATLSYGEWYRGMVDWMQFEDMSSDEIAAKESKLNARAQDLDTREADLAHKEATITEEKGKAASPSTQPPTPPRALIPSPLPNPSTYTTSIKLHIPITLNLNDSNYCNWQELSLVALGRYGLTLHILNTADVMPSDTSPTLDWGCDDYMVLSWI